MDSGFCFQELGDIYEQEQSLEKSMDYFERAADLFLSEEVTTSANQCKQKVAQFAAQLEQYDINLCLYVWMLVIMYSLFHFSWSSYWIYRI